MNWLYLLLDIGVLLCPIAGSFEKKVDYFASWKASFLATVVVAVPFLIWDHFFTIHGFWGFNPDYVLGIYIYNLPIEEYLFFFVVPFACTFIYEVCKYYFRNYSMSWLNRIFHFTVPLYALFLLMFPTYGYYTVTVIIASAIILTLLISNNNILRYAPIAFLFTMIPFFLVNGVLTGGMTKEPVVWYSELEKVPFRLWTIPMEDVLYSFSMLVGNILVYEKLQARFSK